LTQSVKTLIFGSLWVGVVNNGPVRQNGLLAGFVNPSLHMQIQSTTPVFVAGAGIMGAGIAQVAALAGHPVRFFDVREGAAAAAVSKLATTFDNLVAKGRLEAAAAQAALARIEPVTALAHAAGTGLVIEAIVEQLQAKRALFAALEHIVAADCVLATNTSSISVTAIAGGLQQPGRVVGMHFFNPVPLMKLVEVVSGLQTDPAVAEAIFALGEAWGKTPVHARSTPGFIVNRIARPYYAECLALLQEQAAAPEVLDAAMRGAGFRMGPCELIDLIGQDTNLAVTQSVFEANFFDKRYQPSGLQREMVAGGLLGRKSGQGFFSYPAGAPALSGLPLVPVTAPDPLVVHGRGAIVDALAGRALAAWGSPVPREQNSGWTGLQAGRLRLMLTDGRTAAERAAELGTDFGKFRGTDEVVVIDRLFVLPLPAGTPLAFAVANDAVQEEAAAFLATLGFLPLPVADTPGLVAARTVAMLINEAADAVLQGVCNEAGADAAMKLGLNYPAGPFEFLQAWPVHELISLLERLDQMYRGERYRISPWLRRLGHQTSNRS
jgi:3-hydroxybutyryl-CoA dehydrogenase